MKKEPELYGVVAEFDNPTDIVHATRQAYAEGYRKLDAYSPYPIEALAEAVGFHRTRLSWIVFAGGVLGGLGGFLLEYWSSVIEYPLNIGGRPLNSWPSFIVPAFETTILGAALTAVLAMLALNGLPRPHHPLFNHKRFELASIDRFFLVIEARDPKFHHERTAEFLRGLGAREVTDVEDH